MIAAPTRPPASATGGASNTCASPFMPAIAGTLVTMPANGAFTMCAGADARSGSADQPVDTEYAGESPPRLGGSQLLPKADGMVSAARRRPPFECIALLLQGGGALGAYQAGVYEAPGGDSPTNTGAGTCCARDTTAGRRLDTGRISSKPSDIPAYPETGWPSSRASRPRTSISTSGSRNSLPSLAPAVCRGKGGVGAAASAPTRCCLRSCSALVIASMNPAVRRPRPRPRGEPPDRKVHNVFILLIVALFDSLVQFHRLAAELPPEHRTCLGGEDVARVRRFLLSDRQP
jgi:hypothetical protein